MCNFLGLVPRPRWRREGALRAHDDGWLYGGFAGGSLPKVLSPRLWANNHEQGADHRERTHLVKKSGSL